MRVACIGNFDGIHTGHYGLIEKCKQLAQKYKCTSLAITFDPDPAVFFNPDKKHHYLTTTEQKVELFKSFGIDEVLVIPTSRSFIKKSADEFIKENLNTLDLKALVCGFDFTFGFKGQGNGDYLKNAGLDYEIAIVSPITSDNQKISSTWIIQLIEKGNIQKANELLGYNYHIKADIINGKIVSRNVLPLSGNFKVIIDGINYEVNDFVIDLNDNKEVNMELTY